MGRGPADEAVVIVKPPAVEAVETPRRIKPEVSNKEVGGEGRNT